MGKERNREDLQWVQAVLQGDTRAFGYLADRYKDFVYTLSFSLLKQREEAEDAAQDAFVKAFRNLSGFRQDAKFSTWLYRIAYNECITRLRKRKTTLPVADGWDEQHLTEKTEADEMPWHEREEQYRRLHGAIGELSETDRLLVVLYYFERLPVEEISAITGWGISNVKTKLFRVRKKLYDKLLRLSGEMPSLKGENKR
ncbi:MAG TPA: RNA polymerase sigma factor [Bacteroidetes bacterium]|nr:RNA polymerase sigma factor [Bacteroidota bacterium]